MGYTYKCVAAPRRVKKSRVHRTPAEALVAAMEAAIAAEAAQGWEYLRTDLVPMEVKSGFMSSPTETHQGVLVFRRTVRLDDHEPAQPAEPRPAPPAPLRAEPVVAPPRRGDGESEIPRLGSARIE